MSGLPEWTTADSQMAGAAVITVSAGLYYCNASAAAAGDGLAGASAPAEEPSVAASTAAGAAPTEPARFKLYQFAGLPKTGLASYHPACLKVRAYMRACVVHGGPALDFGTDERGSVHVTEEKTLPVLLDSVEGEWIAGASDIVAHLKKAGGGWDLDALIGADGLSSAQRAEAAAFTALVENKLYLAMIQHYWVDEEGCEQPSPRLPYCPPSFPSLLESRDAAE